MKKTGMTSVLVSASLYSNRSLEGSSTGLLFGGPTILFSTKAKDYKKIVGEVLPR